MLNPYPFGHARKFHFSILYKNCLLDKNSPSAVAQNSNALYAVRTLVLALTLTRRQSKLPFATLINLCFIASVFSFPDPTAIFMFFCSAFYFNLKQTHTTPFTLRFGYGFGTLLTYSFGTISESFIFFRSRILRFL